MSRATQQSPYRRTAAALRLLVAVAASLMLAVPASADAASAKVKFSPAARSKASVSFSVFGVQARSIRRAHVRVGRYRRGVTARAVRRAAVKQTKRDRVKLRLPKRVVKKSTGRPLLVVVLGPKPSEHASAPAKSDSGAGSNKTAPPAGEPETTAPSSPPAAEAPAPPESSTPDGPKSTTRAVGSAILSDADAAARVRRSDWEPRPANAIANQRTPLPSELEIFVRDNQAVHSSFKPLVTGAFTGTTDEIIQWAAWKWGLDEDVLRAVAATESWWRMEAVGDGGLSFGMTQIKTTYHAGTHPLSATSTAFNLDYYGALFRSYYDGHVTWLNDVERGEEYRAGDQWGSIGAHFAGRWHTAAAESYISDVKRRLSERIWESKDF